MIYAYCFHVSVTPLNTTNNLVICFFALSDLDVTNIFIALHVLFDIEWAYVLYPLLLKMWR